MKTLKTILTLILIGIVSLNISAQSSVEFKVSFSDELNLSSEKFELDAESEEPMASITAYTLQENVDVHLYYRLKLEKDWGEWRALNLFTEGHTEGRTTFDGGITEETFSGIQFKAEEPFTGEITFRVYYPGGAKKKSQKVSETEGAGANCNCPKPTICYRNCWCPSGNCPKTTSPSYTVADHLIVHHSAGSNSSSNYAAVVRSIWDFHVNTNGWSDIGYNFLIDGNGVIYEARGDSVLGAHFSCMNHETVGICLLGNFELAAPKDSAVSSLIKMLAWEACDKNIAPTEASYHNSSQLVIPNISGHSHANTSTAAHGCPKGTLCPGDSLFQLLPMIRDSVKAFACLGDVSAAENLFQNELRVYPNPAQTTITIDGDILANGGTKQLEVLDHTGRVVISKTLAFNSTEGLELNIDYLPKGIYLLNLSQEGFRYSIQFIKN